MQAVPGYAHARESLMQVNVTEGRIKEQNPSQFKDRSPQISIRSPSKLSV